MLWRKKVDPTYVTSREGHLDVVKVLLENGADVDAVTKHNKTALELASNHPEIVKLLYNPMKTEKKQHKDTELQKTLKKLRERIRN